MNDVAVDICQALPRVRTPERDGVVVVAFTDVPPLVWAAAGRGLHSSTFRLDLSSF
jgi:hypothetical protein